MNGFVDSKVLLTKAKGDLSPDGVNAFTLGR